MSGIDQLEIFCPKHRGAMLCMYWRPRTKSWREYADYKCNRCQRGARVTLGFFRKLVVRDKVWLWAY